jgi:hypothetical protein
MLACIADICNFDNRNSLNNKLRTWTWQIIRVSLVVNNMYLTFPAAQPIINLMRCPNGQFLARIRNANRQMILLIANRH